MQAVPLYLSEIAPAHARGTLNIMFQMATTIGIWVAQWINYGTQNMYPHGWRLSVGLAIVPALILFLGSLIIPDTPNSLVHRGRIEQARRTLERVRGTPNVDAEFADIVEAVDASRSANKMAIFQRKYRPVLVSWPASQRHGDALSCDWLSVKYCWSSGDELLQAVALRVFFSSYLIILLVGLLHVTYVCVSSRQMTRFAVACNQFIMLSTGTHACCRLELS